jgi:hypothetical protein
MVSRHVTLVPKSTGARSRSAGRPIISRHCGGLAKARRCVLPTFTDARKYSERRPNLRNAVRPLHGLFGIARVRATPDAIPRRDHGALPTRADVAESVQTRAEANSQGTDPALPRRQPEWLVPREPRDVPDKPSRQCISPKKKGRPNAAPVPGPTFHRARSSSTCQGRRCRNTTSSSVLLQDQSAIECFRPTHDQGFPVWHARGGSVRDGTNLGDRNATLFDNEGFALCHLAYDLAGLQMELTDRRGLHVTHCNTSLGLPKGNARSLHDLQPTGRAGLARC